MRSTSSSCGTRFLYRSAQAWAAIEGRAFVIPDDVKAVARALLAHRVIVDPGYQLRGGTADGVVDELLETVPVPVES